MSAKTWVVVVFLAMGCSDDTGSTDGGDVDALRVDASSDTPGADAPRVDATRIDATRTDAAGVDVPGIDVPGVDALDFDGGTVMPVTCDNEPAVTYASSGLPLVQSNPGAALALFLDFDGGSYHSHSSDTNTDYGPYNRNDPELSFDDEEQRDILSAWSRVRQYFAMFDVNITTDESAATSSTAWGWIVITEDISGGYASLSRTAIGTEHLGHARVGSSTARIDNPDKARRIAHELGHNFRLEHSGVWEGDTFYKWEDWPDWDGVYGPIMGGGGEGERNGWSVGAHSGDQDTMQDTMDIISSRIRSIDASSPGWAVDDFDDEVASPLCEGLYRRAVLGHPDDVDVFHFAWPGGDLRLRGIVFDVSAALLMLDLRRGGESLGGEGEHNGLARGVYEVRVRSRGGYGEIGEYEIRVE